MKRIILTCLVASLFTFTLSANASGVGSKTRPPMTQVLSE